MIAPVEPFHAAPPRRAPDGGLGSASVPSGGPGDGGGSPAFRQRVARAVAARAEGVRVLSESDPFAPMRAFGAGTSPIREGRPASGIAFAMSAYMEELDASEPDWVEANVDPETPAAPPGL